MAWSTSIVAPPDGSMGAYMASLEKLRGREEAVYWPGHGGAVADPQRFVRALIGHRRMREASILAALRDRPSTIAALVDALYVGLAPNLKGAAALSVFAHLEDLAARGLATTEGEPSLDGSYRADSVRVHVGRIRKIAERRLAARRGGGSADRAVRLRSGDAKPYALIRFGRCGGMAPRQIAHGPPKYPADAQRMDYVNPDAPKGGRVRVGALGTFDNFNPFVRGVKGTSPPTS